MNNQIAKNQEERNAFLMKYRTTTLDGHPTFDFDRYYDDMPTDEMVALRNKTADDIERSGFAVEFYSNFIAYLDRKINERQH